MKPATSLLMSLFALNDLHPFVPTVTRPARLDRTAAEKSRLMDGAEAKRQRRRDRNIRLSGSSKHKNTYIDCCAGFGFTPADKTVSIAR